MAISLVVGTKKAGTGSSASVDTSTATLLVMLINADTVSSSSSRTDLDNKTNTWTLIARRTNGPFGMQSAFYYVAGSPTVGSGHTFTANESGSPAMAMLAFTGTATSSQLDVQSNGDGLPGSVGQAGSVTPSADNEVLVFGTAGYWTSGDASVDSGFIDPPPQQLRGSGGVNYADALTYLIETTATAKNPSMTIPDGNGTANFIAAFKDGGGGSGGGGVLRPSSLTLVGVQ